MFRSELYQLIQITVFLLSLPNLTIEFTCLIKMNYLFFGLFGLPEEPTPVPSAEGSPTLSPAGVMYSSLQKLRDHVETEKLEKTTLKQLVQRLKGLRSSATPDRIT